MSFSFVPDYSFRRLTDIPPDFFSARGITLVLLDLDNTIAPYGTDVPSEEAVSWINTLREKGITLFIVSNSKKAVRVDRFAEYLEMGFIKAAKKPSPKAVLKVMEMLGRNCDETVLIGDQIYTDVLAANNAGMTSIVLKPIKFSNVFLRFRYWVELPFRTMCRNKGKV